jgi:hypothetical protein
MPLLTTNAMKESARALAIAWKPVVLGLLSLLAPTAAMAQESTGDRISLESDFRFSMVGDSQFKERSSLETGNAYDVGSRDVLSLKVREGFLLRFGVERERFNFSLPNPVPLPSKLQSASFVLGTDLQLGEAWIMRLEIQPGFYGGGTELRARNFDIPITIGASYFWSADLQIVAGVSIDPERKYPVLPGAGFRYKCATNWVLDFILPTPRIEYSFSKSLLLYAGGDVLGGSYRMPGNFGDVHGNPSLNDAVVDYTQIRVGGGASWKIRPDLTLELEAGVVPVQEFDFHRADVKARSTEIPPYGGFVLKAAF